MLSNGQNEEVILTVLRFQGKPTRHESSVMRYQYPEGCKYVGKTGT